jgi:hypothetical protein
VGRYYSTHVRMRNSYIDFDRKFERKRPLGRRLCRCIFMKYFGMVCSAQDTKA